MGRAITTPAFAAPRFGGTSVHSLRPISALVAQRQCSRSALHFGQGNNEPFTSCERNRERGPRATPKDETLPHKGRSHTSKKIFASAYLSVLLSAIVLTGNFDADVSVNNIPIFHGVASAAETTATTQSDRQNTQLSTWPPTSDQDLFKSSGTGPSIRTPSIKRRYWDIMKNGNTEEISAANERLLDHAVATINTMYYDSSGGFAFDPKAFYGKWKEFRSLVRNHGERGDRDKSYPVDVENAFATRENAVKSLKWLVSTVNDPYSKYLTREELTAELTGGDDGFLGLGALVDVPSRVDDELMAFSRLGESLDWNSMLTLDKVSNRNKNGQWEGVSVDDLMTAFAKSMLSANQVKRKEILSLNQASNLPIVKAIVPDSPAERAGLVVGDRIASVGTYQFTGMSRPQVRKALDSKFHAENYFGQADLTIAKPIIAAKPWELEADSNEKYVFEDGWYHPSKTRVYQNALPEQVVAFKLSHVKSIPTTLTAGPFKLDDLSPPVADSIGKLQYASSSLESIITVTTDHKSFPDVIGGDAIVHYATLSSNDSIFQQHGSRPVGYIRLTRFSKASTAGYINAINSLEAAGVDSYIIDLRNNYGGVIQEAMLTASTLLRDPHSVLCYTLNSRGGFRPQENMEYIIDKAYPGYFLSSEAKTVSLDQVKKEHPEYLAGDWSSPTSYASLRELKQTRGIKPAHKSGQLRATMKTEESTTEKKQIDLEKLSDIVSRSSQKKIVILINEGTASAAEVFASALHDNGRTVALVGTKTFGKGLIQHTFPMPDGGGLRLTVAEYLTPALSHVTKVGEARFDSGIQPDIRCESKQGIPKNIGADLCVGVALDVLGS